MSAISYQSVASIEPETQSMNDNEPYFIKPFGFRPNSLFVGREAELAEIHKLLFDKKRRAQGTSAVLIQSMPGGGKTHLARQYVYKYKDKFPGGIFWIRAKAMAEVAAGYWDIARRAALKASDEDLSNADSQQVTHLVRRWLNHREGWLLVLDGIHFDDADLRNFIPDNPNTSLIYTSTVKFVKDDHQFMNPHVIRLPLLSAREARRLLLLELDKLEPTKDELQHSMELVQAMGFLPVVIHQVGQRLKGTGEPMAKFARSYLSEPKLRGLGAFIAVVEQLKSLDAIEAINLLHIMCFFSQHIPVEMIALGLKDLDVPVKAFEPVTGRTLNNTFKILNNFALIDRNEPEPSIHSSQSSKGSKNSRDMLSEHVDVVRLHSVVEDFFIDTLHAEHEIPLWLDRAVRVFCCSYDTANDCIKQRLNTGLVEDYRLYEIHGNRLHEHITRYIKRYPVLERTREHLDSRLELIQVEIENRTAESSQVILDGKPDAFQTSIFDRTYSSSDTAPVTPAVFDEHNTGVTAWGIEIGQGQHQSPVSVKSIVHDTDHGIRTVNIPRTKFRPMEMPDAGYDSDMGESTTMTAQPSQRTIKPEDTVASPGEPWQVVDHRRRSKTQPRRSDHRTIKMMREQRYHDSVGSFRPVDAPTPDPRVTRETARGNVHWDSSRPPSRGRMSGQSQAEVALSHLSQISPPPARGGGQIHDRRAPSNRRSQDRRQLIRGSGSYAAAVSGSTRDVIPGYRDLSRPGSDGPTDNMSASISPPPSFAVDALQRIPLPISPPSNNQPLRQPPPTLMPPYPRSPSPYPNYQQPYIADFTLYPGGQQSYSHESLPLSQDPYHLNIYPRNTGPIPYESSTLSPRKRDLPHDYPAWQSQSYENNPANFPMLMHQSGRPREHSDLLPLSASDIARPRYFQYPAPAPYGGYTSQPMSRDSSGHSTSAQGSRRRPSLASTEPLPQLPTFSPRPPPPNYHIYDSQRDGDAYTYSTPAGPARKSPRLHYARAALVTSLDEWSNSETVLVPIAQPAPPPIAASQQRPFNPAAPSFSPHMTRPSTPASLPQQQAYAPPQQPQPQQQQLPYPMVTMPSDLDGNGGEEMSRSGSGGLRFGHNVVAFGNYPDSSPSSGVQNPALPAREREWGRDLVRSAPWAVRAGEQDPRADGGSGGGGGVRGGGLTGLGIQH